MRVYGLQLDLAWEDPATNYARAEAWLDRGGCRPGSLVVLPEMFPTGFSMQVERTAEVAPEPTLSWLQAQARARQLTLVAGLTVPAGDGRGLNQALAVAPDGAVLARYSKLHPFSFAGEDRHFQPGRELVAFRWGDWTVAPAICYDLRFPELFRQQVRRGAEVLVVVANWPAPRRSHWGLLLQARAIENQAYVVGVNRCGRDPRLEYSGDSCIVGPRGELLAEAGSREGLMEAELERSQLLAYRQEFPVLEDRRGDLLS